VNNLPKVVGQQRRGRASNPRLLDDRKSDALPLSHRATLGVTTKLSCHFCEHFVNSEQTGRNYGVTRRANIGVPLTF